MDLIDKCQSQFVEKQVGHRTKDMTSLNQAQSQDLGWVVQGQLQEVSALLTDIATRLEVLSQVLWAKDSQEFS